jgi:type I restriction enzyme R subunit
VGKSGVPSPIELVRLKDVTVELVDLIAQELGANRDIWAAHRRADQEVLSGTIFDFLMRLRPPLVDVDIAGALADRLLDQARASHEKLVLL